MAQNFSLLILCCSFWGFLHAKPLSVSIKSPYAVVINADTGAVIYDKGKDEVIYPASTSKIATLLHAVHARREELHQTVRPSMEALKVTSEKEKIASQYALPAYWLEPEGVSLRLKWGDKVSLKSLLCGMMLCSANDAANAIADHIGGDIPTFMARVNAHIQSLGCNNTHFCNPHGLHHPKHVSTPHDMARIMQHLLQDPVCREMMSLPTYTANDVPQSPLVHNNSLLQNDNRYYYPHVVAGKTGYTRTALYNLVFAASKEGRNIIVVLIKAPNSKQRYRDAITLCDAVFNEEAKERLLFRAQETEFHKGRIDAHLENDVLIHYYPSEEEPIDCALHWEKTEGPVRKGEQVGTLTVHTKSGRLLQRAPIWASQTLGSVKALMYKRLLGASLLLAILAFFLYKIKKGHKFFGR